MSLNMEKKETRFSEEAPPKIHSRRELKELSGAFAAVSDCRESDAGNWSWLAIASELSVAGGSWSVVTFASSTELTGAWSGPILGTGPDPTPLFTRFGFLMFTLAIWTVEVRIVEEVIWTPSCLLRMYLSSAGTWVEIHRWKKNNFKNPKKYWEPYLPNQAYLRMH